MTDELSLSTTFIPHLRTQFQRGSVVLFTGAGFSLGSANSRGEHLPTVNELARLLWEICYGNEPFDESTQLQDVYDAAIQCDRTATARLLTGRLSVDVRSTPDYYRELLSMPWLRIYTLNVDDLAEKIFDEHRPSRPVRSISATSDSAASVQEVDLSIVHLNGALKDIPHNITFGRSQYALRGGVDPFYVMLRHDLASRPVVFVGSRLEEGSMWQHLVMRGPKPARGEKELRPRSYLVTPELNRSKQALLSQHNVQWLKMTAEEFVENVLRKIDEARVEGNEFLKHRFAVSHAHGLRVLRVADIPEGSKTPTEYLLGAEPEWADARQRRIAHRDCIDELGAQISRIRASTTVREFMIVTGTAGTGKSSAMMMTALKLEADGVPTGWIDGTQRADLTSFRKALENESGLGALFIGDADLFEKRLSRMVRDALDTIPRLIIVCECRASRVDRIVDPVELRGIKPTEYTIPYLGDNDIDAILSVLDREHRLGELKGLTYEQRRKVFEAEAGRQMLVAMYKATHGVDFKDRAVDELRGLEMTQRFLYGLVAVAHAHRFFLTRDEIAIASGDEAEEWPRALEALVRRKIILSGAGDAYKARHREIAQFVYDELIEQGAIADVIRALIRVAGTKTSINTHRTSRPARMLTTFISHNLLKRTVGPAVGRQIYSEFEYLLDWDYHYWLHRGALELESENLALAETFLAQSKGIEPNDVFVDNELAYLKLRKANARPADTNSEMLVRDAIQTLESVVLRRPDQRAHAYHIMGSQGLIWAQQSSMVLEDKRIFLTMLRDRVRSALPADTDNMLSTLEKELQRQLLSLAVAQKD
jgi:hypothetical protein